MLPRTPQNVTENSPAIGRTVQKPREPASGKPAEIEGYAPQPAIKLGAGMRDRTDWNGVAFGITLACLIAFQQFKLPPVLPSLITTYGWDRTLAGGFMAVYGLAGLVLSVPIGRAMQHRGMFGLLLGSLLLF